jgi:hypothetical protein
VARQLARPRPPLHRAAFVCMLQFLRYIYISTSRCRGFTIAEMDFVLSESDELLINAALDQSAEACILLLHSRPHLRQGLILRLLRSSHNLHHDSILRIFSLSVFGYEPIQAVEYLMQLKPAGYCGHVFKEGEISYKCATPFSLAI